MADTLGYYGVLVGLALIAIVGALLFAAGIFGTCRAIDHLLADRDYNYFPHQILAMLAMFFGGLMAILAAGSVVACVVLYK